MSVIDLPSSPDRARIIRDRLRNPPNAVPDTGITMLNGRAVKNVPITGQRPAIEVLPPIDIEPMAFEEPPANETEVIGAVARYLRTTVHAIHYDVTSGSAKLGRAVSVGLIVRYLKRTEKQAARALNVIPDVVEDGCRLVDEVLRDHIVPLNATLNDVTLVVCSSLLARSDTPFYSMGDIKRAVSKVFGVPVRDLESSMRTAGVVWPRHVAMGLCRRLTLKSQPEIGRGFGGRDHTTVLHAIRKTAPLIDAAARQLSQGATALDWAEICRAIKPA